ncbi:MAG: nuclear transport factor 2 family protein [Nocardia sp.]|nr:nuclear transport factor 2 family protein [Nocardia sp.]
MAAEQPRAVVEQYVSLMATGTPAQILALYADDAVVEDPIGSDPRHGHAAIGELYEALAPMRRKTELHTARVAGNHAAISFTLVAEAGGHRMTISAIDTMEFDDNGKIARMRAYWGPEDMTNEAV